MKHTIGAMMEKHSDRELLKAALWTIELLQKNLTHPVEPHPYGLAVMDCKHMLRNRLEAEKGE